MVSVRVNTRVSVKTRVLQWIGIEESNKEEYLTIKGALIALPALALSLALEDLSWLSTTLLGIWFSIGAATMTAGLFPGKVSFKKYGISATGGFALFLAILYLFKSGDHDGYSYILQNIERFV